MRVLLWGDDVMTAARGLACLDRERTGTLKVYGSWERQSCGRILGSNSTMDVFSGLLAVTFVGQGMGRAHFSNASARPKNIALFFFVF